MAEVHDGDISGVDCQLNITVLIISSVAVVGAVECSIAEVSDHQSGVVGKVAVV